MGNARKQNMDIIRQQISNIMHEVGIIEERLSQKPFTYTDKEGETHCECRGAYNDYMSRAMASDIFHFTTVFLFKYPELAGLTSGWYSRFSDFNYRIMRMFDDADGDRPLVSWNKKKTLKFIAEINTVMEKAGNMPGKGTGAVLDDFITRCRTWMKRLAYMDDWAFYLHELDDSNSDLFESRIEMFDNDGNKISGIDGDIRELVKLLCGFRGHLAELLVNTAVGTDDHKFIMDYLKIFKHITKTVMNQ